MQEKPVKHKKSFARKIFDYTLISLALLVGYYFYYLNQRGELNKYTHAKSYNIIYADQRIILLQWTIPGSINTNTKVYYSEGKYDTSDAITK